MSGRQSIVILLAALSLAASAPAQIVPARDPRREGEAEGKEDGRRIGRVDGVEIGRSQALLEAFFDGFRDGLRRADRSDSARTRVDDASTDGAAEGRRAGLAAGLATGHARGDDAASAGFLRLEGVPSFRSQAPPIAREDRPPPPRFDACEAPERIHLWLRNGRSREIDPATAEREDLSDELRVPRSPYPGRSDLHDEARRDGWQSGEDIEDWVEGYRDGFDETYEDVFLDERDSLSWSARRELEDDGQEAGLAEGERRLRCSAFQSGHSRGFDEGFDDGFERGFREGWDGAVRHHESGPVIVIESARLADATADGVFEPGEIVTVELGLANAGLVDATGTVVALAGAQSIDASQRVDEPLPAQQRRGWRVQLGAIGSGAPMGATAIVEMLPQRGDSQRLSVTVGRPAVLEDVLVSLDVRDERLVRVVRGIVRSTSSARVDRALRVVASDAGLVAEDAFAAVPPLDAGARTDVAVTLPASPADLARELEAEMRLEAEGLAWMQRSASAITPMERATELAARLPAGSGDERTAHAVLADRLAREMDAAVADPKLYKRLEGSSELARYAAALGRLPADRVRAMKAGVSAPIVARARAKGTPRKVRAAVQDALDPR